MNILFEFRNVRTFIFDIDGVLTDGNLQVYLDGQWVRKMNIKDGYALQLAIKSGYRVVVISGSENIGVESRLRKLGIDDVFMKVTDKRSFLQSFLSEEKLISAGTLYMGDDIPDYECMKLAGLPCCPSDAAVEIKKICSYISPFKGGDGCVRDVIEKTLKLNDHWPLDTNVPSA